MPPAPSLYNQTLLTDDDFVANFVARHGVLDTLIRRLHAVEPDGCGLHSMVIGPRGMGKTSLLRMVAIRINRAPALAARFIPLTFREEQYNVLTLGNFWRNCGEALAEWAETNGRPELAARLDAALPTQAWASDEDAAAAFAADVADLQRRAVLLVDNLDLILNALGEDNWSLRHNLQERQGPIMIGAATQSLRQTADSKAAFYEFFQPYRLEPLDERETEGCMRALAQRRGDHGKHVIGVLDQQPERLRTLHTLTGGNPRVLALIYRLLETAESEAAMADLELLLDQVTPYYKARVEEYETAQQRAVIDAIALNWDPITTGDLSRATNIVSTTLSSLLDRLRKDGLIESVGTSGSYAGHQIVERFLNIWYLMRHGTRRTKQKMRWLVGFLTTFYSSQELDEIARRARSGATATPFHAGYALALEEAVARCSPNRQSDMLGGDGSVEGDGLSRSDSDDGSTAIREMQVLVNKALEAWNERDLNACLETLNEIVTRFSDAMDLPLREAVARAMFNKGIVLGDTGDQAAAIVAHDEVIRRFSDATERPLREHVARALVDKGVVLGRTGDHAAAIVAFNEVIRRFSDATELPLREQVAQAMVCKGFALGETGDHTAAIVAYDEVIRRFSDATELSLREEVARAMFNKGVVLGSMGDHTAAIVAYDEVIRRSSDATELPLREQVAQAMVDKGIVLVKMGDQVAALVAFDEVIRRFSDAIERPIREQVAWAIFAKDFVLGEMDGRAISECERALDLISGNDNVADLRTGLRLRLGTLLLDTEADLARAREVFREARAEAPLTSDANLAWPALLTDEIGEARSIRQSLDRLPPRGLALLDAGLALGDDNFGLATDHLRPVLEGDLDTGQVTFADDMNRLLRLAERKGYGERLLTWFEQSGFADRSAPIYVALKAYVRGEDALLDVNPEVRKPARIIYDRLNAPRAYRQATAPPAKPAKRPRGRPRKAR